MRNILAVVATVLVLGGGPRSHAQGIDWHNVNWHEKTALLKKGMTEQEVLRAVGYRATDVSMETCGSVIQNTAWTCKEYTFGDYYNYLAVYFQQVGGTWLVNSWGIFPDM